MKKDRIVTFGEIMGRLAPNGFYRFSQTCPGDLKMTFAGAEGNVASSLSILGKDASFVTALPKHSVADACIAQLKSLGVDTDYIVRTEGGRLGLFYLETGANQRPSNVIYDRDFSSIAITPAEDYEWDTVFKDAGWFHVSGITPAISENAAEATRIAVQKAKEHGVMVSCDLNFRKKLWQWDDTVSPRELAEKTMREILPFVDVVVGNEEDAHDVLQISAGDTDVSQGKLVIDKYPEVAKKIIEQFPNVSKIAITLRESISATHNNWGAMLFDKESHNACFAPVIDETYTPYEIKNIVDRVGGGDSFAAGLIFALTTSELSDPQTAISFAVAASCLAHSIPGDCNYSSRAEVEALMGGSASGRVVR